MRELVAGFLLPTTLLTVDSRLTFKTATCFLTAALDDLISFFITIDRLFLGTFPWLIC